MSTTLELTCRSCGTTFAYTPAEHDFRATRGLEPPELCPTCRSRERARRNQDLVALYERADPFPSLLSGFEAPGRAGPARRTEVRPQHIATCAACGSETRVPFVPRGDRPVYCRACYNARRGR